MKACWLLVLSIFCWTGHCVPSSTEDTYNSSEYYEEFSSPPPPPEDVRLDFVYHNYAALTDYVKKIALHYPTLTHLYSIGKSVKGRELWVLAVSSTPDRHVLGRPEIKYVGNIHGNEPVSKELLLHLVLHLVSHYDHDPVVKLLLDRSRIHFLFSMNPDGFEISKPGNCMHDKGRKNAADIDLNRNFPDYFRINSSPIQVETRAVMNWMSQVPFILSAGLHGGALVASYPYENHKNIAIHVTGTQEHLSPDDDVFKHLARVYATTHATMSEGKPCSGKKHEGFPNGIINGAKWYSVTGGMQDYNYIYHGTMEVTLEVSCCKHPAESALEQHWLDNRKALIAYAYEALRGVKGFVTDEDTGKPLASVLLFIKGRDREFNSTDDGEYWRILLDGNYTLQAFKPGYEPLEVDFQVTGDEATVLNVTLRRLVVSPATPRGGGGGVGTTPSMNVSTETLSRIHLSSTPDSDSTPAEESNTTTAPTILVDDDDDDDDEDDGEVEQTDMSPPIVGAVSSSPSLLCCTLMILLFNALIVATFVPFIV